MNEPMYMTVSKHDCQPRRAAGYARRRWATPSTSRWSRPAAV